MNELNQEVEIDLPMSLHQSKSMIVFLISSTSLIFLGALFFSFKSANIWLILASGFLVLIIAVMLHSWKNPLSLEISETGFKVIGKTLFKRKENALIPWADIEGFNLLSAGFSTYVTYQFTNNSGRKQLMGGYVIPIIFEADAEEVALLLEGLRQGSLTHTISGVVFRD